MKSSTALIALTFVFALSSAPPALAQTKAAPAQPAAAKPEEKKAEEKKAEEKKQDPKTADYEKAIKDLPKYEGALTVYVKKKDLLLELPDDAFNKNIYAQAAFHTGGSINAQFGWPLGGDTVEVFQFRKVGEDRVQLVRPNTRFRWKPTDPWAEASKLAFPEAILAEFRVEQTDPEKKRVLVNASSILNGDLFKLSEVMQTALGGPFVPDRDKQNIDRIVSTPDATIIRMNHHFMGQKGGNPLADLLAMFGGGGPANNLEDQRSAPIQVTYTWYWPKNNGYQPRLADPRIGYFTVDYNDLTNRYLQDDKKAHVILRWNFGGKKNPSEALSEPKHPMVWVIDSTVPAEYKDACVRGILSWNKAFEKVGYKNALQVIDPPKDGNYDHADGRYNVYRWSITDGADGAIALMRADPFTGEVLNTSINSDASWVFIGQNEYERDGVPFSTAREAGLFAMTTVDEDGGNQMNSARRAMDYVWGFKNPAEDMLSMALQKAGWSSQRCRYSSEIGKRMAFDLRAAEASGMKISKKEYIDEVLATTAAHEVGHCLGLRHNFVSSTNLSMSQLADDKLVEEEGVAASLMDYTPSNNVALKQGHGWFYTWEPGVYDYLAIKYGYAEVGTGTPASEVPALKKIASEAAKRGLEFMTDEDADGWDPYVRRWDLGRDPVNFARSEMELAASVRKWALANLPKRGEGPELRTTMLLTAGRREFRAAAGLVPFFGGTQASRAFSGDPIQRNTLRPVDPAVQRDALSVVCQVLRTDGLNVPESVLQSMNLSYSSGQGSGYRAPLRSILASGLISLVSSSLSGNVGESILENEFKTISTQPYTLREHYAGILGAIFGDVDGTKPINAVRRDVQKYTVDALISQAKSKALSGDVKREATSALARLADSFTAGAARRKNDAATSGYLLDLASTIRRYMNRSQVEGDFGGSSAAANPFAGLFGG